RQSQLASCSVSFDLAEDCGKLRSLICDGSEPESLERSSIETSEIVCLIAVDVTPASDQRSAGPERFGVVHCRVQLDHIGAGNNFVEYCQRRRSKRFRKVRVLSLTCQLDFDLDFAKALNKRLHTC